MTEAVCIKITPSLSTSVIPAIGLTLNTKCSVEGNGLFIVLKAEVFCRELDGVGRLIGFHIDLQALCSGVVSRFYFNGDKLTVTLNDKIYLSSTLGLPISTLSTPSF